MTTSMTIADAMKIAFNLLVDGDYRKSKEVFAQIVKADPGNLLAILMPQIMNNAWELNRRVKVGALQALIQRGYGPATVIDVGVREGTPELYRLFPDARHILIEPAPHWEDAMKAICANLADAVYLLAAAGAVSGSGTLVMENDLLFSHLRGEHEVTSEQESQTDCRVVTLRQVAADYGASAPLLVKIDTDSNELDVLQGAEGLFAEENVFIVECTLIGKNPSFHRIINYMLDRGFLPYDLVDLLYKEDGRLNCLDVFFLHRDSKFR